MTLFRDLKYRTKIRILFVPFIVLIAIGLFIIYLTSLHSLLNEHQERLSRTAKLTENELRSVDKELLKFANLFQNNRTLREYLYIVTVLGGEKTPLHRMLEPIHRTLEIDSLNLYDTRGNNVMKLDVMSPGNRLGSNLKTIVSSLPEVTQHGFVKINDAIKITAIGPLEDLNGVIGYISVGKYLNNAYLQELKTHSGNELIIYANNALGESTLENESVRYDPRQKKLFAGRASFTVDEHQLHGFNGEVLGSLLMALPTESLSYSILQLKIFMISLIVIAVLFFFGISFLFEKALVDPLNEFTVFTGNVAKGNLDQSLSIEGKDEIAVLARHFDNMQSEVRTNRDMLRKAAESLEEAVKERTSELKEVQKQLLQSQKMEAVGHLAGGVAHDFNNILTAILGYGELLKDPNLGDDQRNTYLDIIQSSAEKASKLTQSLLVFSRKQVIDPKLIDLNSLIRSSEPIIRKLLREDIRLEFFNDEECNKATIMADATQIEQVLLNLVVNSRDAMSEGGLITIETLCLELNEDFMRMHDSGPPGKYVQLSITDTGSGIDPEIKDKLFEPFFTTKGVGKGTGLGLSIVYGIIQQHNGFVDIISALNKGTTIQIYFPCIQCDLPKSPVEESFTAKKGHETILIAEDDEMVRKYTQLILEENGYKVISTANGVEAIEKHSDTPDQIDLLILDVIMPEKNGIKTLEEIREKDPSIKALFMSGYTADLLPRDYLSQENISFISKPASMRSLLEKVRKVLDMKALNRSSY